MLRRFRLPILAGLLIGTSYIPFPPWALLFCLVPYFLFTLRASNPKEAFWGGWITQFILNAIGFHWIAYTAVEFGHFPWPVGILVLIGFCAIAHLYFPVAAALFAVAKQKWNFGAGVSVFLLATLFALFELIFPVLFPWHLGYPWLYAGLPGVQLADVFGFEGLNVATIAINAALALAWSCKDQPRKRWVSVCAALGLFAIINVVGHFRKDAWTSTDAEIKVLAVQGNVGNWEKIQAEKGAGFQEAIVQKYLAHSRAGLMKFPDADFILWPETAFPDYLNAPYMGHPHAARVREFLTSAGKPLLTGSYSKPPGSKQTYNGFFLLDPAGNLGAPPYHKTLLLAFGEYFPGADLFPFMMKLFPDLSAFGRGPGPTVMEWGQWKIGPQICYEGLYPWFSRGLSKGGAEIFANVTNDSWFGTYFEPRQHLYMTFARALEFRRPLIRSTNTGITTGILANGDILEMSPLHQEWYGLLRVPYRRNPPHTVFEAVEPLWPWLLLGLAFLLVFFGRARATSSK